MPLALAWFWWGGGILYALLLITAGVMTLRNGHILHWSSESFFPSSGSSVPSCLRSPATDSAPWTRELPADRGVGARRGRAELGAILLRGRPCKPDVVPAPVPRHVPLLAAVGVHDEDLPVVARMEGTRAHCQRALERRSSSRRATREALRRARAVAGRCHRRS